MPTTRDDIKSVHRKMRSWFDRQKRGNGFRSSVIETAAHSVLWDLYEVGYNTAPSPGSIRMLAEKVAELERAIR